MKFCRVFGVFVCFLFLSCSSLHGFRNPVSNGTLYGMVIDEQNRPVEDFKIVCEDGRKEIKNAVTNESGIFVLENMLTGKIIVSGSRSGYVEMINESVDFNGRKKVYCWQINSVEGVLNNAEKYIDRGEYGRALELLENLKLNLETEEEKLMKQLKKGLKMREKEKLKNEESKV